MNRSVPMLSQLRQAYFTEHSVIFYGLICLAGMGFSFTQLKPMDALLLLSCGWLLYLPQEYFSHVWVFHGVMPKHKTLYRLLYRLHLGHHDKPRRLDLLFTPMWYTLPALFLNIVIYALLTQNAARTAALSTGLILGYLMFEWWHLVVHSPYEPGPIMRYVRNQHMGHHHWNERRWYTISPPALILDVLFRSGGPVHQAPRAPSPSTAGLDNQDERLCAARLYYQDDSDWIEEASAIWRSSIEVEAKTDKSAKSPH